MKKYKLTADENTVQNTETTAFVPVSNKEYQAWLKGLDANGDDLGTGKNTPSPQFTASEKIEQEQLKQVQINEKKIQTKMRQMAIEALKADNELPADFEG